MPKPAPHRANPLAFIICLALFIYFSVSIGHTLIQSYHNRQRLQTLQQQVTHLQKQQQQLQQDLSYKSSDSFIEEEARDQLGMAKPNETVVIFPDSQAVLGASNNGVAKTQDASMDPFPQTIHQWVALFW